MKKFMLLCLATTLLFSCKSEEGSVISYEKVNGKKLPVLHFENLPVEAEEIGISEIIDEFEIIVLETNEECLMEYALNRVFYDNKILVSTQRFPGPAPVFMFKKNGEFISEVGKGGAGPGEHTGYHVSSMRATDTIQINFQDKIQLFNKGGEYLGEVKEALELMSDSYRYNRDSYLSPGSVTGYPFYPRDSVLMVFHDASGKILKRIPRPEFPPEHRNGYTPNTWGSSVYRYNQYWNIYMPSIDTLYKIENFNLVPRVILDFGELEQDYNEIVDPKKILGKHTFKLVAENDHYWLFRNAEITVAEVSEFRPGRWGGRFDMESSFDIIDKKSGESRKIKLKDDIWELSEVRRINDMSEILDHNKIVYSIQALEIKLMIKDKLEDTELDPEVRQRLKDLDRRITENSNPVIFVYYLKEKFMF